MAQEIYVECEGRSAHRAVEAVRRDVGALRPGASIVIVRLRDDDSLQAVTTWAATHRLRPSVRSRGPGRVEVRFFVLPARFGALPECTFRELQRARGTRTTPIGDRSAFHAM